MTKKECLEDGYYSEEYFVYSNDGWIYDNETGEPVARFSAPLSDFLKKQNNKKQRAKRGNGTL